MRNSPPDAERANPEKVHVPDKVHVIACGAIAREILAICQTSRLPHIALTCLPAIWHNTPDKIVPGLEAEIVRLRAEGAEKIYIAYADCGTGGMLDRLCERQNVRRIPGPHCYSFFAGNEAFDARWSEDLTAFFLTDFLARQFEAFVVEPLGLDRHPELRDMYFGHYTKLIYFSQAEDPDLQKKALAAAEFLGLEYEYRFTGYGDLASEIVNAGTGKM
ncbi:DUF1638 domain-containing protein [Pararhizobium sp.]|uniref:DUF1638 domain-containing protein n=1 Tax=Pararhizobium sp. TaxID=1977563 RepID=UPI00272451E9|nr:DUF1638 domain-containing protein [Pararhizobium sp.]MDO9418720.1 DUF1638 domain-containing protein [Pararhizobium sp.]